MAVTTGGSGAPRILVATAGRQHADQLAAALVEAGADARLMHGAPIRTSLRGTLKGHASWDPRSTVANRIAARLFSDARGNHVVRAGEMAFDRSVARRLPRVRPDVVIGYENCALATFEAAKRLGIPVILDAASVHHRLQAEGGLSDAGTAFRAEVNARKDAEIALADHILTCSTLARDSYVAAGVPAERVHLVPLGFDPGIFTPEPRVAHDGPVRFVFVGRFTQVKGADLLADALDRLAAEDLHFECRIAADRNISDPGLIARLEPHAELLGKLPHAALPELYRWADALVMPSRFDSFGLVVPEALACGLPTLVSDRVGARDLVRPGANGAIFPASDPEALAALLAGHARDPAPLRAMRPAAEASVEGAEWESYRRRAAATVLGLIGR